VSGGLVVELSALALDLSNQALVALEVGGAKVNSRDLVLGGELLEDLGVSSGGGQFPNQFLVNIIVGDVSVELAEEVVDLNISLVLRDLGHSGFVVLEESHNLLEELGVSLAVALEDSDGLSSESQVSPLHDLRSQSEGLDGSELLLEGEGGGVVGNGVLHPVD